MVNKKNIRFVLDGKVKKELWDERVCPICGKVFYARKKYKKITCSEECYNTYVSEHKEEINEKRRKSNYEAYHAKDAETIKAEHEKARKTCLLKYGVDKPQKTDEYRKRMSKIMLGKDWTQRSLKVKNELIKKYKKICKDDNLELIEFRGRFDCTVKCLKCGDMFDVHVLGYLSDYSTHNLCRHCHPILPTIDSDASKFIEKILIENKIDYLKNCRSVISPFEIDFYIQSKNLGIEVDGNWWHSELNGRGKNYHIDKTIKCKEKGVKLIHIFEDEIILKPNIVKSRIEYILGVSKQRIYARKCTASEITYKEKNTFLNNNHIDGDSVSAINIGLFNNGELVCVGTFGKRSLNKKTNFELIRFANKTDCFVVGGFSKILKFFDKNYEYDTITTYADIRWSGIDEDNVVYSSNGFNFDHKTPPNYFYIKKPQYLKRLNRLNFTKKKIAKMWPNTEGKTEKEIMLENGYDIIWDCGSMVYKRKRRLD